jgi:hypothetical protein
MFEEGEEVIYVVRRRRRSTEMFGFFVTIAGVAGILCGISPGLITGGLGLVFLAFAAISALLVIVAERLDGRSVGPSIIALILLGLLTFSAAYLPIWLGAYYLPAHPELYPKFPTPKP